MQQRLSRRPPRGPIAPWRWQQTARAWWRYLWHRSRGAAQRFVAHGLVHAFEIWAISQVANVRLFYAAAGLTGLLMLTTATHQSLLAWGRSLLLVGRDDAVLRVRRYGNAVFLLVAVLSCVIAVRLDLGGSFAIIGVLVASRLVTLAARHAAFLITAPIMFTRRIFVPPWINIVQVLGSLGIVSLAINLPLNLAFGLLIVGHALLLTANDLVMVMGSLTRQPLPVRLPVVSLPAAPEFALLVTVLALAGSGLVLTQFSTAALTICVPVLTIGATVIARPYRAFAVDFVQWIDAGSWQVCRTWLGLTDRGVRQLATGGILLLAALLLVFHPSGVAMPWLAVGGTLGWIAQQVIWNRLTLTASQLAIARPLVIVRSVAFAGIVALVAIDHFNPVWSGLTLGWWAFIELSIAAGLIIYTRRLDLIYSLEMAGATDEVSNPNNRHFDTHHQLEALRAMLPAMEALRVNAGLILIRTVKQETRKVHTLSVVSRLRGLVRRSDLVMPLDRQRLVLISPTGPISPTLTGRLIRALGPFLADLQVLDGPEPLASRLAGVWSPLGTDQLPRSPLGSDRELELWLAHALTVLQSPAAKIWTLTPTGHWQHDQILASGDLVAQLYQAKAAFERSQLLCGYRFTRSLPDGTKIWPFRPTGVCLAFVSFYPESVADCRRVLAALEARYRNGTLRELSSGHLSIAGRARLSIFADYLQRRGMIAAWEITQGVEENPSPTSLTYHWRDERGHRRGMTLRLSSRSAEVAPSDSQLKPSAATSWDEELAA